MLNSQRTTIGAKGSLRTVFECTVCGDVRETNTHECDGLQRSKLSRSRHKMWCISEITRDSFKEDSLYEYLGKRFKDCDKIGELV